MNIKKILLAVGILIAVLGVWMFLKNKKGEVVENTPTPIVSPESTVSPSSVMLKNVITYTDSGYVPNTLTIKKGETVTWENKSKYLMWTASAMHPTHNGYPGSGIGLCGTNTLVAIFDACKSYGSGDSWSFKFDNVGTWKYHNHSNSSHFGTIVVE